MPQDETVIAGDLTADLVLDHRDGNWIFLPISKTGHAVLTDLVSALGGDPTSPPVAHGVETSPDAAQVVSGLLARRGVRVVTPCEKCRAWLERVTSPKPRQMHTPRPSPPIAAEATVRGDRHRCRDGRARETTRTRADRSNGTPAQIGSHTEGARNK